MGRIIVNCFIVIAELVFGLLYAGVRYILDKESYLAERIELVMAEFVSPSTLDRIKHWFYRPIVEGVNPSTLFCVPVFLRRDGSLFKLGGVVQTRLPSGETNSDQLFCLKEILVSYDLQQVIGCLVALPMDSAVSISSKALLGEETLVDLDNLVASTMGGVCRSLAMDGMNRILKIISTYPIQLQRTIRKHQLCSALRRDVQKFLSGFSIAQSWSLGTVDWRLDPGIFGLERDTEFTLDFHIEKFANKVAHIDLLLGHGWDVKAFAGGSGYRAVLTLELAIDTSHQDIKVKVHAVICSGDLNRAHHRSETLKSMHTVTIADHLTSHTTASGLRSTENTLTRPETSFGLLGTAKSLTWDEFRNTDEDDYNLSSAECSPQPPLGVAGGGNGNGSSHNPRAAGRSTMVCQRTTGDGDGGGGGGGSLDTSYTSFLQPTASVAAATLQELLSKANFNSHNFYYYSPVSDKHKSQQYNAQQRRPNTSTPADDLDVSDNHKAGQHESIAKTGVSLSSPVFDDPDDVMEDVMQDVAMSSGVLKTEEKPADPSELEGICPTSAPHQDALDPPGLIDLRGDEVMAARGPASASVTSQNREGRGSSDLLLEVAEKLCQQISENNNVIGADNKMTINEATCDKPASSPLILPNQPEGSVQAKVVQYINSLPANQPDLNASCVSDLSDRDEHHLLSSSINKSTDQLSSSMQLSSSPLRLATDAGNNPLGRLKSPQLCLLPDDRRVRIGSDEEGNTSVCSSRSRASRTSRASDLVSLNSSRFGQGAIGSLYGVGVATDQTVCPFPDEWQFNTIPEVIENDDEID